MNLSGIFNFPDLSRLVPGNQAGQTGQVGKTPPTSSDAVAQSAVRTDHADLSPSGINAAQNTANVGSANFDVRMQLVNNIQASIQAGTYNVPASDVAGHLIQNMLGNGQ